MRAVTPSTAVTAVDAPSGLPGIATLPWGAHVCQLFRTAEDLAAVLVPYLVAGLQDGEACLWITAEPLGVEAARAALAQAVPDLAAREASGQVELVDHQRWYVRSAGAGDQVQAWLEREARALRQGFTGLRLTGNVSWVPRGQWEAFSAYEREVHRTFHGRRILALCSYDAARVGGDQLLDVVRHHGLALVRRGEGWQAIRTATEALASMGPDRAPDDHEALVYDDERFPAGRVAAFVAEGLGAGEGVLVLLGGGRAAAVRAALAARGLDVTAARARGQLDWQDPEEVLPTLLEDGRVSAARFAAVAEATLGALRGRFGKVRAMGEMVDVLGRRGDHEGALVLERLWNGLLRRYPMPLLCTYDGGAFRGEHGPARLHAVCASHGRSSADEAQPDARAVHGLVAELLERTRALEAEASRRAALEAQRDEWRDARDRAATHLQRLQRVTSALLEARTTAAVGGVVATIVADAAGAAASLLAEVAADGRPAVVARTPGAIAAEALDALEASGAIAEAIRTGRPAWRRAGAGAAAPVAAVALPLDAGGVTHGALALAFARPRALSPVDQALVDDLARQAALALERARALAAADEARQRAEAASRAKDEFLAMLGHELRNPLSPMVTVLRLMELRAPESFRSERGVLKRQLQHMERLVGDLLDVSRITRGKLALERRPVELGEVVRDAVEVAGPLLQERRHRLEVRVPSGLEVDGDAHRLGQVVVNLLTNAARYTPVGGHVSVTGEARGDRVRLVVADDGEGIAPELRDTLFEPFVQGPRGIARSEGGLGLGLAIARSVIELHGGSISVRSDGAGRGAAFTCDLPRRAGALAALDARGPATRGGGTPRRVLVVDDNRDAAESVEELLRLRGHVVTTALDGPSAIELAQRFAPEVALLDIGLPGMDGWELGRLLRAERPGLLCVAVTGYGQERDRARSREAGFAAHLVKPVDVDALARVVDACGEHAAGAGI